MRKWFKRQWEEWLPVVQIILGIIGIIIFLWVLAIFASGLFYNEVDCDYFMIPWCSGTMYFH